MTKFSFSLIVTFAFISFTMVVRGEDNSSAAFLQLANTTYGVE